jgi:cytochrome P450
MFSSDVTADDFDIFASQVPADIYNTYDSLRQGCPLAYTSQYNGFWLLTRHEDIKKVAMDSDTFISSNKAVIPSDPRGLRRPPLNFDAPHHTPYKKVSLLKKTLYKYGSR